MADETIANGVDAAMGAAAKTQPASGAAPDQLTVASAPSKTAFKAGQEVSYEGARFEVDGVDVTDQVTYSIPEGTPWSSSAKAQEVVATYTDSNGVAHAATLALTQAPKPIIPIIIATLAAVAVVAAVGFGAYNALTPKADTGSHIIPQGEMTDEEAQKMLDEQAEASRITVSIRPQQELQDGQLHVNFVVEPPNNGYSERLEIEQNGNIVCSTGIVEPGYMIEWAPAAQAVVGPATATIYAVDDNGLDHGNPISVEVEIVEGSE